MNVSRWGVVDTIFMVGAERLYEILCAHASGKLIRAEVSATVYDATEVSEELRHLIAIVSVGR